MNGWNPDLQRLTGDELSGLPAPDKPKPLPNNQRDVDETIEAFLGEPESLLKPDPPELLVYPSPTARYKITTHYGAWKPSDPRVLQAAIEFQHRAVGELFPTVLGWTKAQWAEAMDFFMRAPIDVRKALYNYAEPQEYVQKWWMKNNPHAPPGMSDQQIASRQWANALFLRLDKEAKPPTELGWTVDQWAEARHWFVCARRDVKMMDGSKGNPFDVQYWWKHTFDHDPAGLLSDPATMQWAKALFDK